MVGYRKNDTLTPNQKLMAAVLSGIITRGSTQPLDVIKLRTQLSRDRHLRQSSMLSTTIRIFREEGVRAFFHGHCLGQVYSITATASTFYVYEMTTMYIGKSDLPRPIRQYLTSLSGMIAGCVSATLIIPLDVIRVRQMLVKQQYEGLIKGARNVYKAGGIFAFYEGWTASMLQIGPAAGISFYVFRKTQPFLLNLIHSCDDGLCDHAPGNFSDNPQHLLFASSIAGAAAGFVSKTVTYPFDLAKRRLQISSHRARTKYSAPSTSQRLIRCSQLRSCLVNAYQKDGIKGLFRGWYITITKAQLTSVITYTTYEILCYSIREFNVA